MKFGKLNDIEHVDFSLPGDDPKTAVVLQQHHKKDLPLEVFIGCTGWSMKEWVGKVYPTGTKNKDYLKVYGTQFNTIELNTTHYRIPTLQMIEKWKAETPEDFRFCPKIPQTISHSRNLGVGSSQLDRFCAVILGLEKKLGCCFMQLPPYFGSDRRELMAAFLQNFPKNIPLAIELRHESWFNNATARQDIFDLLEAEQASTVITDVAGRRDVLHMRLSTPTAMVRFVGNGLHPTDFSRIDEWIQRIQQWRDQGLQRLYFFPHEPDNIQAPELAAYLLEKLNTLSGISTRGPEIIEEDRPDQQQMSLF